MIDTSAAQPPFLTLCVLNYIINLHWEEHATVALDRSLVAS